LNSKFRKKNGLKWVTFGWCDLFHAETKYKLGEKIIFTLSNLFRAASVAQNRQYNYNFDVTTYFLNDFNIPKEMENQVKEVKAETKTRKPKRNISQT
jgi:hypothetical protein